MSFPASLVASLTQTAGPSSRSPSPDSPLASPHPKPFTEASYVDILNVAFIADKAEREGLDWRKIIRTPAATQFLLFAHNEGILLNDADWPDVRGLIISNIFQPFLSSAPKPGPYPDETATHCPLCPFLHEIPFIGTFLEVTRHIHVRRTSNLVSGYDDLFRKENPATTPSIFPCRALDHSFRFMNSERRKSKPA